MLTDIDIDVGIGIVGIVVTVMAMDVIKQLQTGGVTSIGRIKYLYAAFCVLSSPCFCWRLHKPDQSDSISDYENKAGLSWGVVVDLQKIFACVEMQSLAKDSNAPVDMNYIAKVGACESFSSKAINIIASQPDWRPPLGMLESESPVDSYFFRHEFARFALLHSFFCTQGMTIFLTRDSGLVCLLHWLFKQDPQQATTYYIYNYINNIYVTCMTIYGI